MENIFENKEQLNAFIKISILVLIHLDEEGIEINGVNKKDLTLTCEALHQSIASLCRLVDPSLSDEEKRGIISFDASEKRVNELKESVNNLIELMDLEGRNSGSLYTRIKHLECEMCGEERQSTKLEEMLIEVLSDAVASL